MYCIAELTSHPKKKRTFIKDVAGKVRTFEKMSAAKNWVRNNKASYLGQLQIVRLK